MQQFGDMGSSLKSAEYCTCIAYVIGGQCVDVDLKNDDEQHKDEDEELAQAFSVLRQAQLQ